MTPKKTIIKHTVRTTKTQTTWIFYQGHRSSSGNSPRAQPLLQHPDSLSPPPPVVIPQGVQPILPHRQMASERP